MVNKHRASFCSLLAIICLSPSGHGQWTLRTSTDTGTAPTSGGDSGGGGFGYELLRNQLDEMQGGIVQLQQTAGRCSDCEAGIATLQTGLTALLRRLEGVEKTLKETPKQPPRDNTGERFNGLVKRLENTLQTNFQPTTARPPEVIRTTPSIYGYTRCMIRAKTYPRQVYG